MELTEHEIMVGTYEEFILGFKISKKIKTDGEYELTQTFTQRSHVGPVRSLVGVNKFVVSGGSDELCKIFDLSSRVEHGQLMHHQGTVSCLDSHGKTYLFSASDDNSLVVVKVGSWQVEKTLYKHQAGITALAIHPTGKLAFSAGKDRKLITWNLVKARPAFISNIKGIAEFLTVSPDGNSYCVGLHRRVDVYSVQSAGIQYSIDLKCRPNCLAFLGDNIVAVGGESSKVQVHSLIEKRMIKEFEAHETRVRCMKVLPEKEAEAGQDMGFVLVTASSSDQRIKLWRIRTDNDTEAQCIGDVDTTCRITCLTTWHPSMRATGKRKKEKSAEAAGATTKSPKKLKFSVTPLEPKTNGEVVTVTVDDSPKPAAKKLKKKKKVATDT